MKISRRVVLAMVVWFILTGTTAVSAADLQKEFFGFKWGASVGEYPELKRLYAKDQIAFYTAPDRTYSVNDVPLSRVVYGFAEGKLFAIYIDIESLETFNHLKNYIQNKYGDPKQSYSTKERQLVLKWKEGSIRLKMKNRETDQKMKLAIYYSPISRSLNEASVDDHQEQSIQLFPVEKGRVPEMIPLLRF